MNVTIYILFELGLENIVRSTDFSCFVIWSFGSELCNSRQFEELLRKKHWYHTYLYTIVGWLGEKKSFISKKLYLSPVIYILKVIMGYLKSQVDRIKCWGFRGFFNFHFQNQILGRGIWWRVYVYPRQSY